MGHGWWGTEVEIVELLFSFLQLNSSRLSFQYQRVAAWYLDNSGKRDQVY